MKNIKKLQKAGIVPVVKSLVREPQIIKASIFFGPQYKLTSDVYKLQDDVFKETIKRSGAPFVYENGRFVPNKNYYYRRGWGIIDDALDTGIIRVPPGDYKSVALKKYPWLDNGNPFSTSLLNHKFPYFSTGELWPSLAKYGKEPEDLIAIPRGLPWVRWVGGSKWGSLLRDKTPEQSLGRATPLIQEQTNLFPTKHSLLFRLDPETNEYKPHSSGIKYGFNLDEVPKADYQYNPRTGDFDMVTPKKEWANIAESMVDDYFWSPEEQKRLIASGLSPEEAIEIQTARWTNSINRLPSLFRNLGKNIYGTSENRDGRALIRYNARNNVSASLFDFPTLAHTAFHELGGHGSSLNIGAGTQTMPSQDMADILKKIYKHNVQLRPKLKPFYQAIKDGDYETAKQLAVDVQDVLKNSKDEIDFKSILENIKYMEDPQEYSARAIGSNIADHYNLQNGWNEVQLRKYFTDESVDKLLREVWGLTTPIIGYNLINTSKENK